MSLRIREFATDDLETIKEITVQAFEPVSIDRNIENSFGTIKGRDWRFRKARHIEEDARRQPEGIFIAEWEGTVVGYITTLLDADTGVGLIPNLAVDATVRGQGIGRRLIAHALEHFRRQGATHARIETLDQNEVGQNLYPSMGFQEVARQIHYCMKLRDSEETPD